MLTLSRSALAVAPGSRVTGAGAGLGWWWADPAAALVITALAVKEGLEVREDDES
jgi:divalent metal cation (Fe/Co/Zn/Cd) transporter